MFIYNLLPLSSTHGEEELCITERHFCNYVHISFIFWKHFYVIEIIVYSKTKSIPNIHKRHKFLPLRDHKNFWSL